MRLLVIRRDNIGDLVCTTPMIRMLRESFPDAWLGALVTRYNSEVLQGNPHLDQVFTYQKAKHRSADENLLGIYWSRMRQHFELRRRRLDCVILPAGGLQRSALRQARWLGAMRILVPPSPGEAGLHEVERCARVLSPLGINGLPPRLEIRPDPSALDAVRNRLGEKGFASAKLLVALHVSARKPSQRWPTQHFVQFARTLHERANAAFILLWSPGDEANTRHPGDDSKAAEIISATRGLPLLAYPTHTLRELIAALAVADRVVCSDGGAMHLAAGLGKPIVCFFGRSDPAVWRPWGVAHRVLRPDSQEVSDVSVDSALDAFAALPS